MVSRKCLLVGASLLYLAAWIAITVKQFAEPELTSIHPETRARSSHSERGYDFTSSSLAGDKEKVTTSAPGSDSGDTAVLHTTTTTTTRTTATATTTTTAPRTPLTTNDVLDLVRSNYFREQGIRLKWIGERMERLAPLWKQTQQSLMARRPDVFAQPKSILLFPGLVTEYSGYDFANNAYQGGFLGELIQWSDFIASLHLLGHKVTIMTTRSQLYTKVPRHSEDLEFDLIFTDYLGLAAMRENGYYFMYKCRIRVLDSFGTEPIFNMRTKDFLYDKSAVGFTNWNFEDTRQFWTLFPHTPDNSFLGFVVEKGSIDPSIERKNQAVLYGKDSNYVKGKESFVQTIGEIVEIHSTFKTAAESPANIVNHGLLTQPNLHKLLQQSKVFIGLSFPYDGPGPLEALANGCSFIQPVFKERVSSKNTPFLGGKPTARDLTSQLPYLEQFVGEPYVYTVDISNGDAVRDAVRKILQRTDWTPFVSYEFSQEGMMVRLSAYIRYQNFCDGRNLALGKTATASSTLGGHSPGEPLDGVINKDTCFWSESGTSHWWTVDLGTEVTITKIRIVNMLDWGIVRDWQTFIDPFSVTLLDTGGQQVVSRQFSDARPFYVWHNVEHRARFVRLDSLDYKVARYFVLCSVEVYGEDSRVVPWPDLTLLQTVVSKTGQSCKEACMDHTMVCEPSYWHAINTHPVLKTHFTCLETLHLEGRFEQIFPAYAVENDDGLNIRKGSCVTTAEHMLLSCAGGHDRFQRLCPCRRYTKGQVALPPET
ncbi:hypothetical protein EMCRGX_G015362 [Ephydatia muelleri]